MSNCGLQIIRQDFGELSRAAHDGERSRTIADCGIDKKRVGGTFFFLLYGLLVISVPSFAETAPAIPKDEVVRAIENHYRDLIDLTAQVTQKNRLKALGKTQVFEGKLSIKKPGRLRIEYTNGQIIVLDGKTALFYSKKNQQVIRRTFRDIDEANVPVAFLLGAAEISKEFTVAPAEEAGPRAIDLAPKKPGAAMQKLRLKPDGTGRILEMSIFDRSGNVTEITFTDVREGTGVEDRTFEFRGPKGTEIIEQ